MPATKRPRQRNVYPAGDRVFVRIGASKRLAEIVEDRGPIGVDGRRILRLRYVRAGQQSDQTFEVPTNMVTGVSKRTAQAFSAKRKSKIS